MYKKKTTRRTQRVKEAPTPALEAKDPGLCQEVSQKDYHDVEFKRLSERYEKIPLHLREFFESRNVGHVFNIGYLRELEHALCAVLGDVRARIAWIKEQ